MAYTKPQTIDFNPSGDTVKQGITKADQNATQIVSDLNTHEAATTGVHGFTGTKTGSGAMVGATSPTLVTPVLGVATATSINKLALTAPATSATLTIANGKTLTCNNNLTLAGTDGEALTLTKGLTVSGNAGTVSFSAESLTLTVAAAASVSGTNTGDTTKVTGDVVQVVNTMVSAYATGTTQMPTDDSIPQNTEGDEYMTLAITPTSASNILIIEASAMLGSDTAGTMTMALFQDTTANALNAAPNYNPITGFSIVKLLHKMVAGTTGATTFKIRAGLNAANNTYFNGYAGRYFGGVAGSSITIWEIKG